MVLQELNIKDSWGSRLIIFLSFLALNSSFFLFLLCQFEQLQTSLCGVWHCFVEAVETILCCLKRRSLQCVLHLGSGKNEVSWAPKVQNYLARQDSTINSCLLFQHSNDFSSFSPMLKTTILHWVKKQFYSLQEAQKR